MDSFVIKRNDLRPSLRVTLTDPDGAAIDVTAATGITFHMVDEDTATVAVDAAATVVDASAGIVEYQWAGDDTATAGRYLAEFEITWVGSQVQTVPNAEHIPVVIVEDLA